jgi:4-amino-4-deoxy-L-arabinose transferase-like glycosyltransferase
MWGQKEHRHLGYWLGGGLLWRGLIAATLPPGFDEAYYYLYSRHLAWSYFDHPPLVALTTALGPWLLGDVSALSIRLGAVLLYTGSLGLLYLAGRQLFSAGAGVWAVAIASIIPIFHIGFGVLTLPDSPLIFFWTATLYLASCEFFPDRRDAVAPIPDDFPGLPAPYRPTYRLALLGLLVGLACLGKYHGLALGFGLVGFCLTSARHRVALASPWMVTSLGLFLLAISPIVVWNSQQDWISLRFQSGRAIPDRRYSLVDLGVTFLVGTAYLFPTLGFPLWWVSGRSLWHSWPRSNRSGQAPAPGRSGQAHLILWLSLPLMLGFTLMGGYRPILPTWATPGFWGATLLLGTWATTLRPVIRRRWLLGSGLAVASLLLVALSHVVWGTLQKPGQWAIGGGALPIAQDASVQFLDIAQLRQGFVQNPALATALRQADFVFTNDIFLAGQVGMAIAPLQPPPITCLNADLRGFAFWSTAESWVGQTGLLVTGRSPTDLAQYTPYFARLDNVGKIDLQRGGHVVQTLALYQARRLLRPYPRPYGLTAQAVQPKHGLDR